MKLRLITTAIAVAALGITGAAQAHVTVHPNALPAGGFTTFVVRVPNERPKAATTKVDVKFPHGFLFLSYAPVVGWQTNVVYRKLAKPVKVFGRKITQEVDRVVWSGGKLTPGQFIEFPLSVAMPDRTNTVLTFKSLQTYSSGEIVRWIGPPNADEPAPQVMVRAADAPVEDFPAGISAIKKARTTSRYVLRGFAIALPLLGLGGFGFVAARRRWR